MDDDPSDDSDPPTKKPRIKADDTSDGAPDDDVGGSLGGTADVGVGAVSEEGHGGSQVAVLPGVGKRRRGDDRSDDSDPPTKKPRIKADDVSDGAPDDDVGGSLGGTADVGVGAVSEEGHGGSQVAVLPRVGKRRRGDDAEPPTKKQRTKPDETPGDGTPEIEIGPKPGDIDGVEADTGPDDALDDTPEGLPEINEMAGRQRFWARTVVRVPSLDAHLAPKDVVAQRVSISPERRATAAGIKDGTGKQGAHLVAWAAMLPYWNRQLAGPLDETLVRLKRWLVDDQLADDPDNEDTKKLRARALQLIDSLQQQKLPIDTILAGYDEAISLFVESNQKGSFATQGASHGGQAEADALYKLSVADNAVEADGDSGLDDAALWALARPLYDLKYKTGANAAKAVHTWYSMLVGNFPNLAGQLKRALGPKVIIDRRTVDDLVAEWDGKIDAQETATVDKLNQAYPDQPGEKDRRFGVRVVPVPTEDKLSAADVNVPSIEIPVTLRADTQFGAAQQSHTLAWTFKRAAMEKLLAKSTGATMLASLIAMAEDDLKSLREHDGPARLVKRSATLIDSMRTMAGPGYKASVGGWGHALNTVLIEYIEINQALPSSTYSGADRATGHGEPASNRFFLGPSQHAAVGEAKDAEATEDLSAATSFDEYKNAASRYIDMGALYSPLLRDLEKFGDLTKPYGLGAQVPYGEEPSARAAKRQSAKKTQEIEQSNRRPWLKGKRSTDAKAPAEPESPEEMYVNYLTGKSMPSRNPQLATLPGDDYRRLLELAREALKETKAFIEDRRDDPGASTSRFDRLGSEVAGALRNRIEEEVAVDPLISSTKTRVIKIDTLAANYRPKNKNMAESDTKERQALQDLFNDPGKYAVTLVERQGWVVTKVLKDFYSHLQHFAPELHKMLSESEPRQLEFLTAVVLAPLSERDNRIGERLTVGFTPAAKDVFVTGMKAALPEHAKTWRAEIFGPTKES